MTVFAVSEALPQYFLIQFTKMMQNCPVRRDRRAGTWFYQMGLIQEKAKILVFGEGDMKRYTWFPENRNAVRAGFKMTSK